MANLTQSEIRELLDNQLISVLYYDRIFRIINLFVTFSAFFINIFHFSILIRKDLRTTSIFILLIGIAFFDILRLFSTFFLDLSGTFYYGTTEYCYGNSSFYGILFQIIILFIRTSCTYISSWLILWMAIIRSLSIIFPMSSLTSQLSEQCKPVIKLMIFIILYIPIYNGVINLKDYKIYQKDIVNEVCLPTPSRIIDKSSLPPQYRKGSTDNTSQQATIISGLEFIANLKPLLHVFLTIFLLKAVRQAAKLRKNLRRSEVEKTESTTRLITLTTLFYLMSEIPVFLISAYEELSRDDARNTTTIILLQVPIVFFTTINSISHLFVCFFMSSQYKDTVQNVLGLRKIGATVISAEAATGTIPNSLTT